MFNEISFYLLIRLLYILLNLFVCSNICIISFSCWHSEPDSILIYFATNIINNVNYYYYNIYYVYFKDTHKYGLVCHMSVKYFSKLLYTSHVIDGKKCYVYF